jgi:hypothetical protein
MKRFYFILTILTAAAVSIQAQQQDQDLVINELMQSNIECIMDDIKEFPDSWVELYNPTDAAINLKDYKIGNKKKIEKAWQLPDQEVPAKGYVIIYCDKEEKGLHTSFRLESGEDGNLYLFKGNEVVDKLEKMAKMPAPDVAYGRKTDGSEEWGYQLTPTPGTANSGEICDGNQILGAPVFGKQGFVAVGDAAFQLELSLPEGAPEGAFICYTTDGSEPKATSTKYTKAISIGKTTAIRAKVFCDGWLSPMSTAQSYIFHPREMTTPIFSIQTDDRYLNDAAIGLFANNNSKEDKKDHDWRRPMNIEFFPPAGEESAFNQLGEFRIQGGQSRGNALKSMAFYANKRFDPDHKQFVYEFFPDQKPGVTKFKSFSLRDGGNDFGDLYFRDAIIQRTMASHTDLDWQACRTAVLYLNGEYMGMLNIRERSNEENIFSNYNGLEDIDLVEISHEQVNGVDKFIEELKEGTSDFYDAFKTFYSQKGHTKAEYEEWIDVDEYLSVMVMNLFYGNIDFPGNNFVLWRPNDNDTKSGLPKRFRVIVKDTDFGLGLYGRQNNYNTINLLYNPSSDSGNAWAFTEPATRLIKNMLENEELRNLFIDKCCVFMGDFMNGKGTSETIDLIQEEAMEEFVAHRDKYNSGGGWGWGWWGQPDNRGDITNKFNNAKSWAEGRPEYFYQHIGNKWNLGTAIPVTINKGVAEMPESVSVNGIPLSEGIFDGKFFPNRQLTIAATAPEGLIVTGWKVVTTPTSGSKKTKRYYGEELTFNPTACKSIAIEATLGVPNAIETIENDRMENSTIYDLMGNKVTTPQTGRVYIQNGKKILWR